MVRLSAPACSPELDWAKGSHRGGLHIHFWPEEAAEFCVFPFLAAVAGLSVATKEIGQGATKDVGVSVLGVRKRAVRLGAALLELLQLSLALK